MPCDIGFAIVKLSFHFFISSVCNETNYGTNSIYTGAQTSTTKSND